MKRTYQVSAGLNAQVAERALKELKLGYLNLSDGMFEQAKENFLLTLQFDANCADAYWGLMLEKCHMGNEDDLMSDPIRYKEVVYLPECEKALLNGNDEQKNIYKTLLQYIYTLNEGENY